MRAATVTVVVLEIAPFSGREQSRLVQYDRLELLNPATGNALLTDLRMPLMDGYELTLAIREAEAGRRHMPIVALTAHVLQGDRDLCLQAGADEYLAKPIDMLQLLAAIERLTGLGVSSCG